MQTFPNAVSISAYSYEKYSLEHEYLDGAGDAELVKKQALGSKPLCTSHLRRPYRA